MVNGTQDLLSIDRVRIRNASNNNEGVLHASKVLISPKKLSLTSDLRPLYSRPTSNVQKILPLTKLIYLPKLTLIKD